MSARSFSSSRGPESARRSFRLRSEICRVVAVIVRSGRRTRPATSQPSAIETTVMIASAIPDWMSPWWRPWVYVRRTPTFGVPGGRSGSADAWGGRPGYA